MQQFVDVLLQNPLFALRSSTVSWWIENDSVIFSSTFHLPAGKLQRIVHNPTHAIQPRSLHILAGPGNHRFDRIDMSHCSPCRPCSQRRTSCIGKQIQHLHPTRSGSLVGNICCTILSAHQTSNPPYLLINKNPVGRLLRENAHMFE